MVTSEQNIEGKLKLYFSRINQNNGFIMEFSVLDK